MTQFAGTDELLGALLVGVADEFALQDTSYGIPASDLPYIFDRFYRIRDGGYDEIEGNGLGLAIVKSIAERHGGQISVESEVDKGTRFSVSLPLISAEKWAAPESRSLNAPGCERSDHQGGFADRGTPPVAFSA